MANNLDQCIADANAQGISYGKLMADRQDATVQEGESNVATLAKPVAVLTCAHCGKEFPVYDKRKRRYCSDACAQQANVQRTKERAAAQATESGDSAEPEQPAKGLFCWTCKSYFKPTREAHYVATDGTALFDAFDCPVCGCQISCGERMPRVSEEADHA